MFSAREGHGGSLAGRLRAGREALAASRCDGIAAPPTKSGKPCQICESGRWDEREETIFNKVPRKRTMTNDECGITVHWFEGCYAAHVPPSRIDEKAQESQDVCQRTLT